MAFSDLAASDLDGVLSLLEASEAISYRKPTGETLSINAVVDDVEATGFVEESGPRPKLLIISKTDIVEIDINRDAVSLGGVWYRIKSIERQDSAAWELYCAVR